MADFSQFTPYVYVLLVNSIFVSTVVFFVESPESKFIPVLEFLKRCPLIDNKTPQGIGVLFSVVF